MANTIFCDTCGSKNTYEAMKPKFCGACGKVFGSTFGAPAATATRKHIASRVTYQPPTEEYYEEYSAPVIKKPDAKRLVNINMGRNARGSDLVNMENSIERPIQNGPRYNPDLEVKSRNNQDALLTPTIQGAKIQPLNQGNNKA